MPEPDPRARLRAFLGARRVMLGPLQRLNEALSRRHEETAREMPRNLWPQVEPPTLSRQALKERQQMLADCIGELEAAWERRN